MAQVMKRKRLVNPGKRLTTKQKLYFGTKRQRAAARLTMSKKRSTPKRRNYGTAEGRSWSQLTPKARRPKAKRKNPSPRARNIGEIITIGLNPSPVRRKSSMAIRRRKRRTVRANPAPKRRRVARRRRVSAAPIRRRVARRRSVRRRSIRRNPGFFGKSTVTNVLGVLGGAAATKMISERLPYNLSSGILGYVSTGVIAAVLGMGVTKFGKNKQLGEMMAIGGFTYLGLRVLQDFVPSLAALSPMGLRGMGVLGPSSFYVPQVNQRNSMGNFITPSAVSAGIPAAAPANGMKGLGMSRRVGRLM